MRLIHIAAGALALALVLAGCSETQATAPAEKAAQAGDTKGFQEYPIGDDKESNGLKIAAVYFQPVPMAPEGMGLAPEKSDIHLEADIKATPDNQTGFGVGAWIPYLTVKYQITKGSKVQEGTFMAMNANDGPHYGANVKLDGAGTYQVKFTIDSPDKNGFLLHTDKLTGVPGTFWREPIVVSWDFDYIPRQW